MGNFFAVTFQIISLVSIISGLPKGMVIHDVAALATFDIKKLPPIKETGAQIISEYQAIMQQKWSASKRAVIPEDQAQCLLVGVSFSFIIVF